MKKAKKKTVTRKVTAKKASRSSPKKPERRILFRGLSWSNSFFTRKLVENEGVMEGTVIKEVGDFINYKFSSNGKTYWSELNVDIKIVKELTHQKELS